jgi:branched-chain amino acid transport system ATP-binding protein
MLAMGRALLARPRLLVMDEPSMGLSPLYVERVFEVIQGLNRQGIGILLVEQNANMALAIADRGYVLQTGRIVLEGSADQLVNHPTMRRAYLEL